MKVGAPTIDDLLIRVDRAYLEYDRGTLDSIWAQLFSVYRSVLEVMGGNAYTLPHTGNRVRGRQGETAIDLSINVIAYNAASTHVNNIYNF
jgi:hypothetical protein